MKRNHNDIRRQHGVTLVELMIGLMVGLIVIGAVLYVFLGSRLTYKYNDAMGRIQENGRIAIDMIGQDVRMAGFIGCRRLASYLPPPSASGSISAQMINFSTPFTNAIAAGVGVDASELKLAERGFIFSQILNDQISGTDSLTVLSGNTEIPLAALMANSSSNIVTTSHVPAGPAIISDCRFDSLSLSDASPSGVPAPAEAFVVPTAGTTIEHTGNVFQRAYDTDASVTPISTVTYSIRATERNDNTGNTVLALFRDNVELVEGARDLCVRYGVAENASNEAVGEYVTANALDDPSSEFDWKSVIAVRIELLLASVDDNVLDTDAEVPMLCDRGEPPSATPDDPDAEDSAETALDRRMYKIFTTTVGLRNQVRQP